MFFFIVLYLYFIVVVFEVRSIGIGIDVVLFVENGIVEVVFVVFVVVG